MKTILCCAGALLVASAASSQDHGDCFLSRLGGGPAPVKVTTQTIVTENGAIIPDRHVLTDGAVDGPLQAPAPLGHLAVEDEADLVLEFPTVDEATAYWIYRETIEAGDEAAAPGSRLVIDEIGATVSIWGRVGSAPAQETLRVAVDRVSDGPAVDPASVWAVRAVRETDTHRLLSPVSWVQVAPTATSVDPASWAQIKTR